MNTQDEDDDGLQEVELLGRLNKLTEIVQILEALNADHMVVINMWRNRAKELEQELVVAKTQTFLAREERNNYMLSNKGLQGVNKEYLAINSELRVIGTMAAYDRDRARDIAARLEAECARCWGPVHSELLSALRLGESLEVDDVT